MPASFSKAPNRSGVIANYIWQLRPYSYVDLVLLLLAAGSSRAGLVGATALWCGFLIHLEWLHRDRGRLRWHWMMWVGPWVAGLYILPNVAALLFVLLSVVYSLKKRVAALALASPLVNGGLKAALANAAATPTMGLSVLILVATSIRNLAGDFRDVEKDSAERVVSLPVSLGWRRNQRHVYPLVLMITSAIWVVVGGLPWWWLVVAWAVQGLTYTRTPR